MFMLGAGRRPLALLALTVFAACGDDEGSGPSGDAAVERGDAGVDATVDAATSDAQVVSDSGSADAAAPLDPQPSFAGLTIRPDLPTTKVADCAGQPDLMLCEVATTPDRWYDVCVAGVCVSPGCDDGSCNTSGPHFAMPPMAGSSTLEKQSGDEPVSVDLVTGMHWTSCLAGQRGADCAGGAATAMDLPSALAYCDDLSWAGHDDWYLPDLHELMSLVQVDVPDRSTGPLSPAAFPKRVGGAAALWSTSMYDSDRYLLSKDDFVLVRSYFTAASELFDVLCARRGFSSAMPAGERFVRTGSFDDGQPVIDDRATGLTFQACHSEPGAGTCIKPYTLTTVSRTEAVKHCDDMTWAGHDDWRLPTFKELFALFDHRKYRTDELDSLMFRVEDNYIYAGNADVYDARDGLIVGINRADKGYEALCVRRTSP